MLRDTGTAWESKTKNLIAEEELTIQKYKSCKEINFQKRESGDIPP